MGMDELKQQVEKELFPELSVVAKEVIKIKKERTEARRVDNYKHILL